jgi:seryl-tRNA synthetase
VIDLNLLRENPEAIKASQRARGRNEKIVDQAVELDAKHRKALADFESLRAEQNAHSKLVATAPKDQKASLVAEAGALSAKVKAANELAGSAAEELDRVIWQIENVVLDGVPAGGEADYVVIKEVGNKPSFDFEPKDHVALGESLDVIDMERGAKISGSRFYFLKGMGARLELALMNLALDKATNGGFSALITPTLVRPEIMAGTGFLGEHADEIYYLPADDLYLTGTSEVALAGYHRDEITDVFLTHLHFDHCGGVIEWNDEKSAYRPAFKNANVWSNEAHWKWATEPNAREKASFLKENILPIQESGQLRFAETDRFSDQIEIIRVHGHTESMMLPLVQIGDK